jgi:hypothetical protein
METFEAAVVVLPKLTVTEINNWLAGHGRSQMGNYRDRALCGCLLARKGFGLIFINGSIEAEERRFAIGHEFSHFFVHYLEPRRRAIARFGDKIIPVLDGNRAPTTA